MSDLKFAYQGEAQLVRWAESGAAGRTVTLRLDEEASVHPFKGLKQGDSGQRMQVVIVLIDDHEKPLAPEQAKVSGVGLVASKKEAGKKAFRDMPRSQQAALKLRDPEFQGWLAREYAEWVAIMQDKDGFIYDLVLKAVLTIRSKTELDSDEVAAAAWDALLTDYDTRGYSR